MAALLFGVVGWLVVMATSALLSIFAVFVAIRACRPATKERYSAALLCGLVGHALAPILLVLVLTGSPSSSVLGSLWEAPRGAADELAGLVGSTSPALRASLAITLNVGSFVGFFSALHLAVTKRSRSSQSAGAQVNSRPPSPGADVG